MKKLFILFVAVGFAFAANAQSSPTPVTTAPSDATSQPDPNAPVFKFTEETFDFGTIPQGTPAPHSFVFTNVGKSPLIISTVDKSCGCTTPTWSSEPVLPGKTGTVTATYNAAGAGAFTKSITIHSNASEPTKTLFIKGTVQATATDQTPPSDKQALPNSTTPANTGNTIPK